MDPASLSLVVAFGAGVLSFLSPCVLPLVPAYVGYLAGTSMVSAVERGRLVTLFHSGAFVLGFSVVFVGLWTSLGLLGYGLSGYRDPLRQVGGVVLILLGLHQTGLLQIPLLHQEMRFHVPLVGSAGPVASFVVGVAFAAGWTPCIGPILGGILGLATMSETVGQGSLLLVAYSLGLGVPFLAAGFALSEATSLLKRLRRYLHWISAASGILLFTIGLLMLSDSFKLLPQYFQWGAV